MKKIFLVFAAATCLLGSCSEDNTSEEQGQGSISITGGGVINAGPDGMEQAITVTSSGDWRLSGICEWAHPSATSGKSGDVVTFTIDPNSTDVNRDATFKFFTGAAVTPLKIISALSPVLELKSETELNCDKNAQSLGIKLSTNIAELTTTFSDGGDQWIHFDSSSKAFGMTVMFFKVDANATYENRSSVVTISGEGADPVTITVTQKQTDIVIPEKLSYSFGLDGGTVAIKLQTNIEYVVEIPAKYAAWLHHQPTVAPTSRAMTDQTETFTIDASAGLRGGRINFKSKDGAYSVTVNIAQSGGEHHYVMIPDVNFQNYLESQDFIVIADGAKCELTLAGEEATSFSCAYKGIKSLEGIVAFTKLTTLKCSNNPLESIPLGDLAITSLDLSSNYYTAANLVVSGSNITKLNISYVDNIKTLDVSGCPAMADLNISYCYLLSKLYLTKGQVIAKIKATYTGEDTAAGTYEEVYK